VYGNAWNKGPHEVELKWAQFHTTKGHSLHAIEINNFLIFSCDYSSIMGIHSWGYFFFFFLNVRHFEK
jgi:hypothetical protein